MKQLIWLRILTIISRNIIQITYINIVYNIKEKSAQITKDKSIRKELHKQLYDEIGKVKKDLTHFGDLTSDQKYHEWIINERIKLYPNRKSFDNNNIFYHLKSNTQDFLYSMFHISIQLENLNEVRIQNKEKQIRLFNVLPLRTNIISKNICIDTCGLICNFLGEERTNPHLKEYKKDNNQFNLWNRFFNLNKKVFKKGQKYKFSHIIRTDGVSCCILFIRVDTDGNPIKKKKCCEEENIEYIEKVEITDEVEIGKGDGTEDGLSTRYVIVKQWKSQQKPVFSTSWIWRGGFSGIWFGFDGGDQNHHSIIIP